MRKFQNLKLRFLPDFDSIETETIGLSRIIVTGWEHNSAKLPDQTVLSVTHGDYTPLLLPSQLSREQLCSGTVSVFMLPLQGEGEFLLDFEILTARGV